MTIRAKSFPASTVVWPDETRNNTIHLNEDVIISTQSFAVQESPMSYSAVIESIDLEVGSTVFSFTIQEYCTYKADYNLSAIKIEMILYAAVVTIYGTEALEIFKVAGIRLQQRIARG